MSVSQLLDALSTAKISLLLDGDKIRVNAPKGALTPELRNWIRSEREALVAVLSSLQGSQQASNFEPIDASPPGEPAPLSHAQYRLWFLDQVNPGTAFLNLPFTLRIRGALDRDALRWVTAEIGRRHDALRSSIRLINGAPMQRVEDIELQLDERDFSALPESEREPRALAHRAAEMARPFDLQQAPLIRFWLMDLGSQHYLFFFVTNHVVFDGWSHDILFRDLKTLYEARVAKSELPPAPPVRYADFVRWQRAWLAQPGQARQLEYWVQRLQGMPGTIPLPFDRPRQELPSFRGQNHIIRLESDLIGRLRRLAQSRGATLNMLALAAAELVLGAYSGAQDFGLGVPTLGRNRAEVENLIGMFVNTTVVRSDLPGARTFAELLTRVRNTAADALSNQDTPFEELVRVLRPGRDRNRTPLYQVVFSYQEASSRDYRMADLQLEQVPSFSGATATDATFWLRDHGTWALAVVETDAQLFTPDTTRRFAQSWLRVLETVVQDPDISLDRLVVLAPDDETRVLHALNQTAAEWDRTALVHRLFERVVDQRPNEVALQFEERSLTFRELDCAANRLAHALVNYGAEPDTLIGVCLRRTPELVIALLAVLKSGAAYVPIDPDYPEERIEHITSDAACPVIVTTRALSTRAPSDAKLLLIDEDAPQLLKQPERRLSRKEDTSQLAYVIYTSGSTGKPKGVMVEHCNVTSFFVGMQKSIALDGKGVWLSGTSTSFDMSIPELWGSLCHGRRVILLGETVLGRVEDPRYTVPALIRRHSVTHFQCTPSQARLLLAEAGGRSALAQLQQLIVGGEALPQDLADDLAGQVSGTLINGYGPTETTVFSTTALVRKGQPVTIGRPISNTVVFIVDEMMRLVPPGTIGELLIGGAGVTRGYRNQDMLTEARFLPNRFRPDIGGRLYRTGDVVRYRPDGEIEYLGRNDHQVKIRGYRVELGELESLMRTVPGVCDAVVIAKGATAEKRLVGYVVVDETYVGDSGLRIRLRSALPEFMVPSAIVHLESLPLTPNGKVDRKALPDPVSVLSAETEYVPPDGDIELRVCEIWQRALGLPRVGVTDDFFELGGHSFLALEILNGVEKGFGERLPIGSLFEFPNVRALSKRLAGSDTPVQAGKGREFNAIVPIQPSGDLPPFFCVAGVGGNPMELRHLAESLAPEQPFFGFQYRGVDGNQPPRSDVCDLALDFIEGIRSVQPHGPYYLGGFSSGGLPAFEAARLLHSAGETVALVVLIDTFNPTLPNWTLFERITAHWSHVKSHRLSYIVDRLQKRALRNATIRERTRRAKLARHEPFKYRVEAVEAASLEATRKYVPRSYAGDVVLIRADFKFDASEGIGYQMHESNGWRDVVRGTLEICEVTATHQGLVDPENAVATGTVLVQALRKARQRKSASG